MAIIKYEAGKILTWEDDRNIPGTRYCLNCKQMHDREIHDDQVVVYSTHDRTLDFEARYLGDPIYVVAGFLGRHYSDVTPTIVKYLSTGIELTTIVDVLKLVKDPITETSWEILLITQYGVRRIIYTPDKGLRIVSNLHAVTETLYSGMGISSLEDVSTHPYTKHTVSRCVLQP
jgi:hypothetical protein